MDWIEAKKKIKSGISVGDEVNTSKSNGRRILSVNQTFPKYNGGGGFVVQTGHKTSDKVEVPWSMLEKCYDALST